MEKLLNTLSDFFKTTGFHSTYWIAYSGGCDSHVLLHCSAQLRSMYPLLKIGVIHINHQIHPAANDWAAHCELITKQLSIPFQQQSILCKTVVGDSLEAIAREQRYAALASVLSVGDILLTAHHQDDQAETLLLQLLRGAGPKGLASMPKKKSFGKGFLARPFLNITREELEAAAISHQLSFIQDDSNTNKKFTRNFIRHTILPQLKSRWPSVTATLARSAEQCAESQFFIEKQSQLLLQTLKDPAHNGLSIPLLLTYDPIAQRQLLRTFFIEAKFPLPSRAKLHEIQFSLLPAQQDKQPVVCWEGVEIRRYQHRLYAMSPLLYFDKYWQQEWNGQTDLHLPTGDILFAASSLGQYIQSRSYPAVVRFRRGGEVFQQYSHACRHSLKKLFQTWQIPPWERDRVPLIFEGEKLIAIYLRANPIFTDKPEGFISDKAVTS